MKVVLILLVFLFSSSILNTFAKESVDFTNPKYQAIVLGKMIKKKVVKSDNFYLTEYKLKSQMWLYKKPEIKKSKYLKVKILGAELEKEGLIIKTSCAPDFVPLKKEAIFFLENNKKKKKNTFTLSKGGIVYGKNIKDIVDIFEKKKEI